MSLRMSRLQFTSTSILMSGFCLLAFQNCSPANFKDVSGEFSSKGVNETPPVIPEPSENETEPGNEVEHETDGSEYGTVVEGCDSILPVMASMSSTQDLSYQHIRGPLEVPEARNLSLVDTRGPVKVGYALNLDSAQNMRGPFLGRFSKVNRLVDFRGPACIAAHSAEEIQNYRGVFTFVGIVEESKIARIERIIDTRGNLRIKDADIGSIQNTRGNMILENVKVGSILDHSGNIVLINSTVDKYENVRGQIQNK